MDRVDGQRPTLNCVSTVSEGDEEGNGEAAGRDEEDRYRQKGKKEPRREIMSQRGLEEFFQRELVQRGDGCGGAETGSGTNCTQHRTPSAEAEAEIEDCPREKKGTKLQFVLCRQLWEWRW